MQKKRPAESLRHRQSMPYTTSEMLSIMQYVEREIGDDTLVQSMHFSPTALTVVRRVMLSGGMIVTDTTLAQAGVDEGLTAQLGLEVNCFIDDPQVVMLAEQRRITRAEVAVDYALSLPGPKLMVIGSAPMALDKLLKRRQAGPLNDVVVLATPTGFASVIQLKERIWEIDIPSIVVRGRKGGTSSAVTILNGLMNEIVKQKNG